MGRFGFGCIWLVGPLMRGTSIREAGLVENVCFSLYVSGRMGLHIKAALGKWETAVPLLLCSWAFGRLRKNNCCVLTWYLHERCLALVVGAVYRFDEPIPIF
ncbi:hypothetical protein F4861DRAFT_131318 [Xylaria intraflava]|nr:hypothetical protein F4861DRAFT_131318 [Xylaria intraflava]